MWIIFALGASVLWGLTYALNEQVYKKISVSTSLAIVSLAVFVLTLFLSYSSSNLKADLTAIAGSKRLLFFVISGILTVTGAELLIASAIKANSATLAGLVEISYPIFIAIFSYVLFKESELTVSTIVGGIFIFIGLFIISFFN